MLQARRKFGPLKGLQVGESPLARVPVAPYAAYGFAASPQYQTAVVDVFAGAYMPNTPYTKLLDDIAAEGFSKGDLCDLWRSLAGMINCRDYGQKPCTIVRLSRDTHVMHKPRDIFRRYDAGTPEEAVLDPTALGIDGVADLFVAYGRFSGEGAVVMHLHPSVRPWKHQHNRLLVFSSHHSTHSAAAAFAVKVISAFNKINADGACIEAVRFVATGPATRCQTLPLPAGSELVLAVQEGLQKPCFKECVALN